MWPFTLEERQLNLNIKTQTTHIFHKLNCRQKINHLIKSVNKVESTTKTGIRIKWGNMPISLNYKVHLKLKGK